MAKQAEILTFTRDELRGLTDSRSWRRGVGYYEDGNVVELREDGGRLFARVEGTRVYTVELWRAGDRLVGSCSCPMGESGVFCKHCVATGLTYLKGPAADDATGAPGSPVRGRAISFDDLRAYLEGRDRSELVDLLIQQAKHDDVLRRELVTKAALCGADSLDVAAFRDAIDEATETGGFVDYREAYAFAQRIHSVIGSLREVLAAGHAEEAVELAEHALRRVEDALGSIDDSDGNLGYVRDCLVEFHHEACVAAKPDPELLAGILFEWELASGWGTLHGAVDTYADVLGERGIAAYRRLAEAEWERLGPPRERGEDWEVRSRRRTVQGILESLARADGDVEAAWAEAQAGGCSQALWMELAEQREADHPADAVPIYQREVERLIARTSKAAYRDAVRLIRRIGRLMAGVGQKEGFRQYLQDVRTAHKRKRNLIRLLDNLAARGDTV